MINTNKTESKPGTEAPPPRRGIDMEAMRAELRRLTGSACPVDVRAKLEGWSLIVQKVTTKGQWTSYYGSPAESVEA